jgi:branched-chain amino acid transport system substrate-binding protein
MNFKIIIFILLFILGSCSKIDNPVIKQDNNLTQFKELIIADINNLTLNAVYIQSYYAGMQLAIEEINKTKQLKLPIKLIKKDDYYSYVNAYNIAKESIDINNAAILSGTYNASTAKAVATFSAENNVVFLSTGVSNESFLNSTNTKDNTWVFRLKEGYNTHIKAIMDSIIANKNLKSVVIVAYGNDEGDYVSRRIRTLLKTLRKDIVIFPDIRVAQSIRSSVNFNKIQTSPASAVIVALDGPDVEPFVLKTQQNSTLTGKQVYIFFAGEPEWLEYLGRFSPKGWVSTGFPYYGIKGYDKSAFFNNYVKKYKVDPKYASYLGYNAVYLMANAFKTAGYGESCVSNTLQCKQKLKDALSTAVAGVENINQIGNANITFNSGFNVKMHGQTSNIGTYIGVLEPIEEKKYGTRNVLIKADMVIKDFKYVEPIISSKK